MFYESGSDLVLESTSKTTKGKIKFGTSAYDEGNNRLGLLTQAPSFDLSLGGEADFTIQQEREATADTAGRNAKLQAGGAKSGSTDKAGGNLTLASGIATGTGTSRVLVQTAGGGSTGTDDAAPATALEVQGDGTVIAGKQAQLAQAATGGFLQIPVIADAPSGAPTLATGKAAIVYCLADHKIYVYLGGTWRSTAALT